MFLFQTCSILAQGRLLPNQLSLHLKKRLSMTKDARRRLSTPTNLPTPHRGRGMQSILCWHLTISYQIHYLLIPVQCSAAGLSLAYRGEIFMSETSNFVIPPVVPH